MKRTVLYIVCAMLLAVASSSCNKKGEVIPRAAMSKIYADLFIADSWLAMASPEDRGAADTTAFYEPVFKKYGYSTADYLVSVEYYLNDPERFSRIVKKARINMRSDMKALEEQIERERIEAEAALERQAKVDGFSAQYLVYGDFVREAFFTDRINMEQNENGVYVPSSSQEEMSYRGPRVIFKSDSLAVKKPEIQAAVAGEPDNRELIR